MLYDNDDYLNGLDHSVHKDIRYFYLTTCSFNKKDYEPGEFLYDELYTCISPCPMENPYCFPNPYLPGNNPYPPEPEISKLWHIAKQECNITDTANDIKPNNDCLNERFGRSDEPAGEEKCRMYYFWRLEVKSRACMVKNAKLEELDKYKICVPDVDLKRFPQSTPYIQDDDAFLCTEDSVIYKQKLKEEVELRHQQKEEAKQRAEAERKTIIEEFNSVPNNKALLDKLVDEEMAQLDICENECYTKTPVKKGAQCNNYTILDINMKSKYCMKAFATKEELSLYEICGATKYFICLKGSFLQYKDIVKYVSQSHSFPRFYYFPEMNSQIRFIIQD